VEQVDLDEEAPCVALRNMSFGDVCPKESEEPPQAQDQPSSSIQASPPTCWGLVLKCYELKTRQHKMLTVNALRPSIHYFP
jgi:hypothetical protein